MNAADASVKDLFWLAFVFHRSSNTRRFIHSANSSVNTYFSRVGI